MTAPVRYWMPHPGWQHRPSDFAHAEVADVAVNDSSGRVYLFTRRPSMVMVHTLDGEFRFAWGRDTFTRPHGITVLPDGSVLCVDDGACVVRRFTGDGVEIGPTLGGGSLSDTGADWEQPDTASRLKTIRPEGGPPFNHPTAVTQAPDGNLYVSDGYGNCKVHRFSLDGELLASWGRSGSGPGEFRLPHSIATGSDGQLYLADRENDRIQVFSLDGDYVTEWHNVHAPLGIAAGPGDTIYVSESRISPGRASFRLGCSKTFCSARISVFDLHGQLLERFGEEDEFTPPGAINLPHGIAVDAVGAVYSAELTYTAFQGAVKRGLELPDVYSLPSVQKLSPGSDSA